MKRARVGVLLSCVAVAGGALFVAKTRAADEPGWRKLRPDAPPEPEAKEYEYAFPKLPEGWTPPSREELEKLIAGAKDGAIVDTIEVGAERARTKNKPQCTVAEALALKNDSDANNEKIVSAMCQPPASDDEVDYDATFNRHAASPTSLNSLFNSSAYETYMNALHAPGLFGFDHDMKPLADPDFVKRWKRTEDIDYVELRDDVMWEDGVPFTAEDIEFSFHAIMDTRVPVPSQRTGPNEIKWVKAYDKNTIVFFHKEKLVTNVWNVNFSIVPKHIFSRSLTADPTMSTSDWHAYWNRHPLSGNAYRLKEWKTAEYLLFERREDFWKNVSAGNRPRHRPYFKQVRFKIIDDVNASLLALKAGDLDELIVTAPQWVRQTNDDDFYKFNVKVRGPEWTFFYVGWNERPVPDKPFFKDARVRKALALACDHDEIMNKIYFGLYTPSVGPFNPASPWGCPELKPLKQNVDEAEKLLDEAGWKLQDGIRQKDGVRFEFTCSVPTGGTGDKVAEVLKENLKDIGIVMNVKMLEWATYQTLTQEHKFEANIAAWGSGTDPDSSKNIWMTEMYDKGRNYVGYSNPKVDDLFKKGQYEFDPAKRMAIYQDINRTIFEDQPYLFLLYRATFWAFSKDMRGYNFSPRGPFSYGPGSTAMWKPKKKS